MTVTLQALGVLVVVVLAGCAGAPAASPSQVPTAPPTDSPTTVPSGSPPPTEPPTTPTERPAAQTLTFDDGALTIEVPAGALEPGVQLVATQRGPDDRAPELADIQFRGTFYGLEPDGLTFAEPLRITRRVTVAETGFDLATDGLPLVGLALRTSDGVWSWLEEQSITTDGEYIYASGDATHTSSLYGFGGSNFAQWEWSAEGNVPVQVPDDWSVPAGGSFSLNATITAPVSAPAPPNILWSNEPFTHTGVIARVPVISNSPNWADLPQAERSSAMPQVYHELECVAPGPFHDAVGYDVVNLGSGSTLYERLNLPSPATSVNFSFYVDCTDNGGTDGVPEPTAGCVIVVHTARGTFVSYLRMLLGFAGAEIARIEVTLEDANDDDPAIAEAIGDNVYEAILGLRGAGPKRLTEVLVTDADGQVHDVTSVVIGLLGGDTIDVPFPGEPTFGSCPVAP